MDLKGEKERTRLRQYPRKTVPWTFWMSEDDAKLLKECSDMLGCSQAETGRMAVRYAYLVAFGG